MDYLMSTRAAFIYTMFFCWFKLNYFMHGHASYIFYWLAPFCLNGLIWSITNPTNKYATLVMHFSLIFIVKFESTQALFLTICLLFAFIRFIFRFVFQHVYLSMVRSTQRLYCYCCMRFESKEDVAYKCFVRI